MVDRTMPALLRNLRNRVTSVERRIARGTFQLPARLSQTGAEVTDWGDAVLPGFYWGVNAIHQPERDVDYVGATTFGWFTGQVVVSPATTGILQIQQMLTRSDYGGGWEFSRVSKDGGTTWGPWNNIGFVETWTDIRGYLASGVTYAPDTGTTQAGLRMRRVGRMVEASFGNIRIDSINIPVNGNVANRLLFSGIPEKFHPDGSASISAAWNGRMWSGYISGGSITMGALVPNANATGTQTVTDETFSGTATYPSAYRVQ